MKKIGGILFFFGVGSIILQFLEREFIILMWIDLWGPQVGWTIRIAMVVVGGLMWLMGQSGGTPKGEENASAPPKAGENTPDPR